MIRISRGDEKHEQNKDEEKNDRRQRESTEK